MKHNLEYRLCIRIADQLNHGIDLLSEVNETHKSKLIRKWIHEGVNKELQKLYGQTDKAA